MLGQAQNVLLLEHIAIELPKRGCERCHLEHDMLTRVDESREDDLIKLLFRFYSSRVLILELDPILFLHIIRFLANDLFPDIQDYVLLITVARA